jgi:hypothetical protein
MIENIKTMNNLTSTYLKDTKNIVIGPKKEERFIHLPFNKKDKYFSDPADLVKFIKDVEFMIRTSKEYHRYIRYLKEDLGLRNCVLFREINDRMAPIEMHHGPIFTLFDLVEIKITYLYKQNVPINSYRLAHYILKDHWDNIIQVAMLCKSAHAAVHNSVINKKEKYFLSGDLAWGDINAFIHKYHEAFSINHYNKLKDYIKRYDTFKNKNGQTELFNNTITYWADVLKDVF